ncbi:MAG TPA: phage tail tube protein [Actinokineospora sp.]|jgi:predicted secreted protein|nr:phage tail tube protein [Actinokineospora sp.]
MPGIDAFGTRLERSNMSAPAVFTAIANIADLSSPELSRDTIEVTSHDSPDQYREYKGSLKDAGEVTATLNYDPGDHDVLIGDLDDDDPRDYRMVWPDDIGSWAFAAIMTKFVVKAPTDDKLSADVTFKVTGKPAVTTGP